MKPDPVIRWLSFYCLKCFALYPTNRKAVMCKCPVKVKVRK